MRQTIYALVDPLTHQIRYVGRTGKTLDQRLADHIGAARRNMRRPVYDWIRQLATKPIILELQVLDHPRRIGPPGSNLYHSTAQSCETKWMKRFERSLLLQAIPRQSRAYKKLVNSKR
jgi:hypothetical protein